MTGIKHLAVSVDTDDLETGVIKLIAQLRPDWSPDQLKFKVGLIKREPTDYLSESYSTLHAVTQNKFQTKYSHNDCFTRNQI